MRWNLEGEPARIDVLVQDGVAIEEEPPEVIKSWKKDIHGLETIESILR